MTKTQKVASTVFMVLVINVISRALALFASILVTSRFGAGLETSAYSYALTLVNAITTVIGTVLTTAVVPIFVETMERGDKERAYAFINNTISLTVIVSTVLIAAGMVLSPYLASLSDNSVFAGYAIRVLLFAIGCIGLYFIFSSVLQSLGNFFMPAMVSLPSGIVNIAYILLMSKSFGVHGLVVATLTGFILQAAFLVIPLKKAGFTFRLSCHYRNDDIKSIATLMGPVLIGVCAHQINIITNNSIAINYDSAKSVILNNAQNLGIQIVLTLVLAVTSVMYPKFSKHIAADDQKGFVSSLVSTLKSVVYLLVPISFLFFAMSQDLMGIVYGYGRFTEADVILGGSIFGFYAISILGIGFKEVVDRAYYAMKNTKVSAYNGVLIMGINISLSFILVRMMGFNGIAIAYSVASLVGGFTILFLISNKLKSLDLGSIIKAVLKAAIGCVPMGIIIFYMNRVSVPDGKIMEIVFVALKGILSVLVYVISLYLLRVDEVKGLKLRRKV